MAQFERITQKITVLNVGNAFQLAQIAKCRCVKSRENLQEFQGMNSRWYSLEIVCGLNSQTCPAAVGLV